MKKLIISCDDLGISEEINLGIKDCFDNGVATSSSIVVNGEFYNHALNEVITNLPTKFYGLHLNLTEGKALSENCVNKICDKNNMFNISAKKYFLLNFVKSDKSLEKIIYEELKLQIEKALDDGIKISHFDSHEHIHHAPWIFNIISTLGKEFNINKIRFVNEKIVIKNYFNGAYNKLRNLNYLKHLVINICNKKIKNNFISPDYFFGILNSGKMNIDEFFLYFENIEFNKVLELCVHPGSKLTDNISANPKNSYERQNRILEKNLLLSNDFRNFLTSKKVKLINFNNIV